MVISDWSSDVCSSDLEGSLEKLELYDEIDDETGLYNARNLIQQTDLEMARARRYQTLFSVVLLDVPVAALASLRPRQRRALLQIGRAASRDRVVHHVEIPEVAEHDKKKRN